MEKKLEVLRNLRLNRKTSSTEALLKGIDDFTEEMYLSAKMENLFKVAEELERRGEVEIKKRITTHVGTDMSGCVMLGHPITQSNIFFTIVKC